MATASRSQVREETTSIRRRGTNARLRDQTITAKRAEVRGQILDKAGSVGFKAGRFLLALVAIVAGSWYGWNAFSKSEFASLKSIEVCGMTRLSAGQIALLSGLKAGHPLAKLDLNGARKRLESDPWIRDARVSRRWPHQTRIEIVERIPVARLAMGDWISVDGVIMPRRGTDVFPLLVGQGYVGGKIPMKRAVESLSTLRLMELAGWTAAIEQIGLVPDGSMELRIANLTPKILVGSQDWKRAMARVGALQKELGKEVSLFSEIDLRHGTCAALRRATGGV